jgi:hypothetical protein
MTVDREGWLAILMSIFAATTIIAALIESYQIWFS